MDVWKEHGTENWNLACLGLTVSQEKAGDQISPNLTVYENHVRLLTNSDPQAPWISASKYKVASFSVPCRAPGSLIPLTALKSTHCSPLPIQELGIPGNKKHHVKTFQGDGVLPWLWWWFHRHIHMSVYQIIHFKYVLFTVCQLYSKKAVFKSS